MLFLAKAKLGVLQHLLATPYHHLYHHIWARINPKLKVAFNPKLDQLIQPLSKELGNSTEQMAPDLLVADQPSLYRREEARPQLRRESGSSARRMGRSIPAPRSALLWDSRCAPVCDHLYEKCSKIIWCKLCKVPQLSSPSLVILREQNVQVAMMENGFRVQLSQQVRWPLSATGASEY